MAYDSIWRSSFCASSLQRGVALIVTLILLAVTLVMALAFLAISRRESSSVTTQTAQMTAQQAADSALAAAEAQIAANILASTNPYNLGLLVSTNYVNPVGFDPAVGANLTNVSYFDLNGNYLPAVGGTEFLQALANLLYAPRPPVFIPNPTNPAQPPDFRFYLDLNRNGVFDDSGIVSNVVVSVGGQLFTNGTAFEMGDPQWVGVLEHPDQPYGPNNRFLARWAFLAVPADNALDLNYIHNQALNSAGGGPIFLGNDGYFRNQGVGTWEINLAAFLADLNTNVWDNNLFGGAYQYNRANTLSTANTGAAFDDARALLTWRYGGIYNSLARMSDLFINLPNLPLDNVDLYSDGPLQVTVDTNFLPVKPDVPANPWLGADNTNHFFNLPGDLFDQTKSSAFFVNRLTSAGLGADTYDRYTFYRLLEQLGTDSSVEQDKIDLNYSNAVVTYTNINGVSIPTSITVIPGAETNLVPWAPQNFFLAAADRMLRFYTTRWFESDPTNYLWTYYGIPPNTNFYIGPDGFGLTNYLNYLGIRPEVLGLDANPVPSFGVGHIPVWVNTNFVYRSAVNRLLQLAANLYDASTNSFYPDIFRPIFERDIYGNIFIAGYTNLYSSFGPNTVTGIGDPQLGAPYEVSSLALNFPANQPIVSNGVPVNVYGVPWIIGAKKGFPGLNQFSMISSATFERLLEVTRNTNSGALLSTNQLVLATVKNSFSISFWNSYSNDYVGNLQVYVKNNNNLFITNQFWSASRGGFFIPTVFYFSTNRWPGSHWTRPGGNLAGPNPNSFISAVWTNYLYPPGTVYDFAINDFVNTNNLNVQSAWDPTLSPLPQMGLASTNWLQACILDGNHVIDYVQLRAPRVGANLNSALKDPNIGGAPNYYLWVTNNWNNTWPSWGIVDQIDISTQPNLNSPPGSAKWVNPPNLPPGINSVNDAKAFFRAVLNGQRTYSYTDARGNPHLVAIMEPAVQAGYSAVRTIFAPFLYQVNDPLVHYMASDLDAGNAAIWANSTLANGFWYQDNGVLPQPFPSPPNASNPGILNARSRFQPWGQGAAQSLQNSSYNFDNPYNLVYKDPLIWAPDDWDFPTNKYPTVGWIGRVHRGTPWQTVYLKAHNVLHTLLNAQKTINSGTNTWQQWIGETGDANTFDAVNSVPLQDRLLFDLFTTAPNENAARGRLSVNVDADRYDPVANPLAGLAAWSALFSGMVALTNTAVPPFSTAPFQPAYGPVIIQPAGAEGLNSALGYLVTNINYGRSVFTNADGTHGVFEHAGDILSVPALTEQSPFLNTNLVQQQRGISDQVYEWLPQQMMSLLDCPPSPRYVIYAYGQGLQPAPGGIYLGTATLANGQSAFGMVTNYQVVSETALRAVVRFEAAVTNLVMTNVLGERVSQPTITPPRAVIESYNVLPPD